MVNKYEQSFVEKFKDRYDLSMMNFKSMTIPVTIICPIHGELSVRPSNFVRSEGCTLCNSLTLPTAEFVEQAIAIHGNRYDYSRVDCSNKNTTVTIVCSEHGEFEQLASVHLNGSGCSKCSGKSRTLDEWIELVKPIHDDVYDYSRVSFDKTTDFIDIICPIHGVFNQRASSHQQGYGCKECASDKSRMDTLTYIDECKRRGYTHTYDKLNYTSSHEKVTITCSDHGDFDVTAYVYLQSGNCPACVKRRSSAEIRIYEFVKSKFPDAISNDNHLGIELDIYVPSKNIAIEYNGVYWHSSGSTDTDLKMRKQHLNKTEICHDNGIQLFHIFSNEYDSNPELWNSMIMNALGESIRVYARTTTVHYLEPREAHQFLNDNHMQGSCNCRFAVGLFYENELISLMTFGNARYSKAKYELLRFCTKKGYAVVGGASKLIHHFRRRWEGSIVSYANKRWSDGNLYDAIGFEYSHDSDPCYWYTSDNHTRLVHRSSFMKHKLRDKLEVYDETLSEAQNMYANGYRRIWDCGNKVYFYR